MTNDECRESQPVVSATFSLLHSSFALTQNILGIHLDMIWSHYLAYFFGGAFLTNALPHFVSGLMGRAFQSPFAKPPGKGLSSSTVNVLWGFLNLVVGYALICRVGDFDLHSTGQVAVAGAGALLMGLMTARHFGRFHGGNVPGDP